MYAPTSGGVAYFFKNNTGTAPDLTTPRLIENDEREPDPSRRLGGCERTVKQLWRSVKSPEAQLASAGQTSSYRPAVTVCDFAVLVSADGREASLRDRASLSPLEQQ